MPSIEESLSRLHQYSVTIAATPFSTRTSFSRAVLCSTDFFEAHCLREAEVHELSLFQTTSSSTVAAQNAVVAQQLELLAAKNHSIAPSAKKWERLGPLRRGAIEPPTPLRHRATTTADEEGPERYLLAAKKLLEV